MGIPMTVQPAKFEMHGQEYKPRKKGANKRQKKVAAQAEEKALGWGGFDDQLKATEVRVLAPVGACLRVSVIASVYMPACIVNCACKACLVHETSECRGVASTLRLAGLLLKCRCLWGTRLRITCEALCPYISALHRAAYMAACQSAISCTAPQ